MQTASQRKLEDICSFEPRNRRRSCQNAGKVRQRRRKRLGKHQSWPAGCAFVGCWSGHSLRCVLHGNQHSCHPAGGWSLVEWHERLSNGHRLVLGCGFNCGLAPLAPGHCLVYILAQWTDRKSTRLNSSHTLASRMPSSA